jgi:hypothetical protein
MGKIPGTAAKSKYVEIIKVAQTPRDRKHRKTGSLCELKLATAPNVFCKLENRVYCIFTKLSIGRSTAYILTVTVQHTFLASVFLRRGETT